MNQFARHAMAAVQAYAFLTSAAIAGEPPVGQSQTAAVTPLLGPHGVVREVAAFTTERGEHALLVLFVTSAVGPPPNFNFDEVLSCPEEVSGEPLAGTYHLALVIDGRLINELPIPAPCDRLDATDSVMSLPLRNRAWLNYWHWGQGKQIEYGTSEGNHIDSTHLLALADYTGEGHAWQVRLIQAGCSCGHLDTLLAGYSARQRRVIIYPIVLGPLRTYWQDGLFPSPTEKRGSPIVRHLGCDHGSETEWIDTFVYDLRQEAWVQTRHMQRACPFAEAGVTAAVTPAPAATPIVLQMGSASGRPGEQASVEVRLAAGGQPLSAVQFGLLVNPDVPFALSARGDVQCEAQGERWTSSSVSLSPHHCTSTNAPRCQWAAMVDIGLKDEDAVPDGVMLWRCTLAIPPGARAGKQPLAVVEASATLPDGRRALITATDGMVTVAPPAR